MVKLVEHKCIFNCQSSIIFHRLPFAFFLQKAEPDESPWIGDSYLHFTYICRRSLCFKKFQRFVLYNAAFLHIINYWKVYNKWYHLLIHRCFILETRPTPWSKEGSSGKRCGFFESNSESEHRWTCIMMSRCIFFLISMDYFITQNVYINQMK